MAATMEDVDVFTIPHFRMKHLLQQASSKVRSTDFSSTKSFSGLLNELITTFIELKHHEEIENRYIMKILKQKLRGEALKKLLVHLHAHSHIADILNHVKKTEQEFRKGLFTNMKDEVLKLNDVLQDFFDEYVPHMREEEQVLQPLLMEFLSRTELKQIKDIVLQLHHLKDQNQNDLSTAVLGLQFSLEDMKVVEGPDIEGAEIDEISGLPVEIITKIMAYLDVKDLCRCAQVSKQLNKNVYSSLLWRTLRPSNWAKGDWRFGDELTSEDCNCDCPPNFNMLAYKDQLDDKSSEDSYDSLSDTEDAQDEQVKIETKILNGLNRYVLPKIGSSVKTLVLECSRALTNGLLFRMLSQCSNLEYLDVSQTIVSDLGLMGLFKVGCQNLRYLDVSGCINITDKMLLKLTSAIGKPKCKCRSQDTSNIEPKLVRQLNTLRLSGCYKITDAGLIALSKYGGLPFLHHLDLSGCLNVTSHGIQAIVAACPVLDLNELFYCDNIADDCFELEASGCQNNGCLNRFCCRTFR